jgi:hypothetical protein
LLSEVGFGALLVYSPRGQAPPSKRSRDVCYSLKAGEPKILGQAADRLRQVVDQQHPLSTLFSGIETLVPMPRSAPLLPGGLWPAERIAHALVSRGLAAGVSPALERFQAVPRSAVAAAGQRPSVQQHYDTLRAQALLDVANRIVIVDDVLTKNATALAAASRLVETYPHAQIAVFAMIRTKGLVPDIDTLLEPVMGTVQRVGAEAHREP